MQPTSSSDRYRCFESSIKLYQIFGLFTERPSAKWLHRAFYMTPWVAWYVCTFFMDLNFVLLLKNYLQNSKTDIRGTEIFQRAFEAFLAPLFIWEMRSFTNSYYKLVVEMRKTFDTDAQITARCCAQERRIVIFSLVIVSSVMVLSYYRKLIFGLPPNEVELVAYYYEKQRPDRQLPFIMWFPFDDTVDPAYYFVAVANVYLMFVTLILGYNINSCMLIFAIHVQGQYEILAKYLHNVGNPHLFVYRTTRGPNGAQDSQLGGSGFNVVNEVRGGETTRSGSRSQNYDPNDSKLHQSPHLARSSQSKPQPSPRNDSSEPLKTNQRNLHEFNATTRFDSNAMNADSPTIDATSLLALTEALRAGRNFERDCVTYILRRHQRLNDFRNRLESALKLMVLIKLCAFDLVLTLFFQFICSFSFSFALAHSSELIQQGNDRVRTAAYNNPWYTHLSFTRNAHSRSAHVKLLLLLMRRCQQPARLVFYGGSVDICYRSLITVLRFCYSIFALMKRSIQVK
ncbi:hypothetical protein M8J76_010262 [Diaphorina citri]|nr:hypothetical protein M8J76_010262 [Diaphorina citri]